MDCELMLWSLKAEALIREQYPSTVAPELITNTASRRVDLTAP